MTALANTAKQLTMKYSAFGNELREETEMTEIERHLNLVQMKKSQTKNLLV